MNLFCPICSEGITSNEEIGITKCGHMFHNLCCLQWFERSRTCPQCRTSCHTLIKLHLSTTNDTSIIGDASVLQSRIDDILAEKRSINSELYTKTTELDKCQKEIASHLENCKKYKKTIQVLEGKCENLEILNKSLHSQIKMNHSELKLIPNYKKEIDELKEQIEKSEHIQIMLSSTVAEVGEMLKEKKTNNELATMVITLKRELAATDRKKNELRNTLRTCQHDSKKHRDEIRELQQKISCLESDAFNHHGNNVADKDIAQSTSNSVNKRKTNSYDKRRSLSLIDLTDSPYLHIKASSVGLNALIHNKKDCSKRKESASQSGAENNHYSIMNKKPRLVATKSSSDLQSFNNFVYNGLGSTDKVDNFEKYPIRSKTGTSSSSSLSNRVKNGALKNIHNAPRPN